MSTLITSKLNLLLQHWPSGLVMTDVCLESLGINKDLKHRYIKSNWLAVVGHGAVQRAGDVVEWQGGVSALQDQLHTNIHVAGKTALEVHGLGHFAQFNAKGVVLFATRNAIIPKWFLKHDWGIALEITKSSFLPHDMALEKKEVRGLMLTISSPERALFELLYFVPNRQSFEESALIMENLIGLRPTIVQQLLEQCRSIKVKRLFLFLAQRLRHPWFEMLDSSKVDIGEGKRSIVKHGVLEKKYQITIPKGFINEEQDKLY